MRCPALKDLPPSSPGKIGWPWTEDAFQLPDCMLDGSPWPKISIITPSYNQGRFIEETIRSVLLQGYPNLEYIVMDGGSDDNSVEIIRRYEKYLAHWVSEADNGQTHAINKGFALASGVIVAWINSDDLYVKDAFNTVTQWMCPHGKILRPIIYGDCDVIDMDGRFQKRWLAKPVTTERLITFWRRNAFVPQPTVFMARDTLRNIHLDESLHYVMDWELYLRLSRRYPFFHIPACLAKFRMHQGAKTSEGERRFRAEQILISKRYWNPGLQSIHYRLEYTLTPLTNFIQKVPWFMRQFMRRLLKDRTYDTLRNIKRRWLPKTP